MDPLGGKMAVTPSPTSISTKLQRIADLARQHPETAFTTLAHHITLDLLHEAFKRTRKDGAPGIDGRTGRDYEADLEANLRSLLDRLKSGTYRAPPVRGVEIPKGKGKTRPIGIPTIEDKVLQRAVAMVLEPIYETDFRPCSYGFRPGRSTHQALEALRTAGMRMGGGWVIEVDIKSFFDTLSHEHLRNALDQRVRDGVIRRAIDKWLKAGVQKDGALTHRTEGTPQGGVISPLLANVYLHLVLDVWFETAVRPRLKGEAHLIRYADDVVILLQLEEDARRVYEVLPKRFGKFGLTLHPEKTKLVDFRRPPRRGPPEGGTAGPGTFDLLGFTLYWGRTRKGNWVIKLKTARSRLARSIRAITQWIRAHRHDDVAEQQKALTPKMRGHYQYYGVTHNSASLGAFFRAVTRQWHKWLGRRGSGPMVWPVFRQLLARLPLLQPFIAHSYFRPAANPRS